jgi:cytochrome c1
MPTWRAARRRRPAAAAATWRHPAPGPTSTAAGRPCTSTRAARATSFPGSLEGIGSRALIAGTLANTQENRERWILFTQQVKPGTAMPQLGVAPRDARDIAAYLGTLK